MKRWRVHRDPGPIVHTLFGRPTRWIITDPSGQVAGYYYAHHWAIRDADRYARTYSSAAEMAA